MHHSTDTGPAGRWWDRQRGRYNCPVCRNWCTQRAPSVCASFRHLRTRPGLAEGDQRRCGPGRLAALSGERGQGRLPGRRVKSLHVRSYTIFLPFQPATMSTVQLAAVSYLARYSGRTQRPVRLPAAAAFRSVQVHRAGPAGREPARPHRALHPQSRRPRPDGLLGEHDGATPSAGPSGLPTSMASTLGPGRLRPAAEDLPR